jgi:hypothetical protein
VQPRKYTILRWTKSTEESTERTEKQQFDEDGEVIDLINDEFKQPLDEDAQGKVLTMSQLIISGMDNSNQTPDKQDNKPAAK